MIAFEGTWLGGEAFVSFDGRTMELLEAKGLTARFFGRRLCNAHMELRPIRGVVKFQEELCPTLTCRKAAGEKM